MNGARDRPQRTASGAFDRRAFLGRTALAAAGVALGARGLVRAETEFDLVVRGGLVLDGTTAAARPLDLGIVADTVRAVGRIDPERGRRVLDATGLHVAALLAQPGAGSDDSIRRHPGAESRVHQGITTEVTGNCGYSAAPTPSGSEWSSVGSYFEALEELGIATNQALLLGQGSLRRGVVGGDDRPATREELAAMKRLVEEGMEICLPENRDAFARRLERVAATITALRSEVAAVGARFVVALVPDEYQVDPRVRRAAAERAGRSVEDYDLEAPQRLLSRRLVAAGVEVIDLLPAFRRVGTERRLYRPRDTHWNPVGARLAAGTLARTLEPRVAEPTTPE